MYALGFATPFFLVFGWLSDRIGRKWIMLAGMLLAILSYRSIYSAMYEAGSVKNKTEVTGESKTQIAMAADEKHPGDSIRSTDVIKAYSDGTIYKEGKQEIIHANTLMANSLTDIKVSKSVLLDSSSFWKLVWLVFIQVVFVTMVYGPIAAFLVEMFPIKIRYTSMSLPYHIGNGIFGGLLPAIATFLATRATQANEVAAKAGVAIPYTEPYLEGLWYPIIIASVCFVIGVLYINNTSVNHEE
jgi:MFS family permease